MSYPYYPGYPQMDFNQFKPQYQPPRQQDDKIYVPNETAAEAYLVAPGSSVTLWDSNAPVFYVKQSDVTGRQFPTIKYEYHQMTENSNKGNAYEDRIAALEQWRESFESKKKVKRNDAESNEANATV